MTSSGKRLFRSKRVGTESPFCEWWRKVERRDEAAERGRNKVYIIMRWRWVINPRVWELLSDLELGRTWIKTALRLHGTSSSGTTAINKFSDSCQRGCPEKVHLAGLKTADVVTDRWMVKISRPNRSSRYTSGVIQCVYIHSDVREFFLSRKPSNKRLMHYSEFSSL